MSMLPKGGDTIWGGLDWSPEGIYNCAAKKPENNTTSSAGQTGKGTSNFKEGVKYGRIISFGKDVAELHSSKIDRKDFRVICQFQFINVMRCLSCIIQK